MKADTLNLSAAEQRAVQMLRLLANPARFRIVTLLAERKEGTAAHLAAAVGLAQSTLAEHLGGLRDAGVVQASGEGPYRCYCLDPEAVDFLAAYLGGVAQQARAWEGLVVETRTAGGLEIRDATLDDASAIARIYNQGIEDRVATLETQLRSPEERAEWLAARERRHPVLVAIDSTGAVLGWASLNRFNPRPAYDHVADFSVYVAREQRGRGVGDALLGALVERAQSLGYHKLVLAAFPTNAPGMRLYERHGFTQVGVYHEQGMLDGKWVDVVVMERMLG
ncbi:MAG: GNAT family N-acetyltransferase [Chloroflexia bacterium]|nr:GNAT family N-acetyltransferase [Chloroflexia bacterium]